MPPRLFQTVEWRIVSGPFGPGPFTIIKSLDRASVPLATGAAAGTVYPKVTVALVAPLPFEHVIATFTLTNAVVSSVQMAGTAGGDGRPTEQVSFAYGKIAATYTVETPTGGGGPVTSAWDLTANKRN